MSDAVREFVANAHGDIHAVPATRAEDRMFVNVEAGGEQAAAVLAYLGG
jgi:hypothetical protein